VRIVVGVETNFQPRTTAAAADARPNVELDVGGADFLLRGKFAQWQSGLAFGPDLDQVNVRLAIDATSTVRTGRNLFAFHSRNVEQVGPGLYRATGTLTGGRGAVASEVMIESPPGHTALVILGFAAAKQDFGDGWPSLIESDALSGPEHDGPTPLAHAWMVAPELAAA
jgi:hypothetical protein